MQNAILLYISESVTIVLKQREITDIFVYDDPEIEEKRISDLCREKGIRYKRKDGTLYDFSELFESIVEVWCMLCLDERMLITDCLINHKYSEIINEFSKIKVECRGLSKDNQRLKEKIERYDEKTKECDKYISAIDSLNNIIQGADYVYKQKGSNPLVALTLVPAVWNEVKKVFMELDTEKQLWAND